MKVKLLISVIIALLLVIFAVQNANEIDINFWFWSVKGSLAVVLLITFLLGIVVGMLSALPSLFRKKEKDKKTKTDIPLNVEK
jgi:lipopolysaccharide assembly protein A